MIMNLWQERGVLSKVRRRLFRIFGAKFKCDVKILERKGLAHALSRPFYQR